MASTIHHGDCLDEMRRMPDNSIDAIVTDPPYGLGFMGAKWDALPPGEDWARECLRVLKPGGYLVAFGGSRTWHRLAVAIEDAGFDIRDSIVWLYGSGFPKSQACLKPAHEPIVLARKKAPVGGGLLNIDACRIEGVPNGGGASAVSIYGGEKPYVPGPNVPGNPAGRWPANVVLTEEAATELDAQSGELSSGGPSSRDYDYSGARGNAIYGAMQNVTVKGYPGTGGASRFFYVAKASKKERPVVDGVAHPTVKPLALMRWLVRLVTPVGGTVLDTFAGSGTTVEAAILEGFNVVGIEREAEYLPLIQARIFRAQSADVPLEEGGAA